MNEFIIWDERYRVFRKLLKIDFQLGLYFCIDTVVPFEKGELVKNIGLKDINGKSIYADSSIVEFQWINGFGNVQTDWGVFKYDIDYLQYLIYEENEDINKSSIKDVLNIKIIDTIQENKLGLIKA